MKTNHIVMTWRDRPSDPALQLVSGEERGHDSGAGASVSLGQAK